MWIIFINCREAREFCLFYLKTIALVIFIFHNLISQNKCHEMGHGRGFPCKKDNECDKNRFLLCTGIDNTCDCQHSSMIWIPEENSCMIMEDFPCGRQGNEEKKCVTNSSCVAGKCECNDGYLRNGFGKCELDYGEVCSDSLKCATRYLLECTKSTKGMDSKCKCMREGIEFVWDENKRKCVSTAGGACDLPESPNYEKDDRLECIENAECVGEGFCKCKPGFNQTRDYSCMLQLGELCNSSEGRTCDIHQSLVCREGKCDCELYGQMKYDDEAKQCRLLEGEQCHVWNEYNENYGNDNGARVYKCIKDSFCKTRHGSHQGLCTCLDGMEKQDDGTCSRFNKGHGLPCSTSIDCDKNKFLYCPSNSNDESRCECFQNDMYFDGKVCRVRGGRRCTENKLCANHSYCEGDWCVCEDGYVPGPTDCILKVPTQSSPNSKISTLGQLSGGIFEESDCDNISYREIERARCHCQAKSSSHIWVEEKTSCLALVGINCLNHSDCVPNAFCDEHEGTCQCSFTAHTTKDRTCNPSANSKHPVDPHTNRQQHHECTEIRTLKSVRSQDVLYSSSATEVANCISSVIFVTTVAIVAITN